MTETRPFYVFWLEGSTVSLSSRWLWRGVGVRCEGMGQSELVPKLPFVLLFRGTPFGAGGDKASLIRLHYHMRKEEESHG